MRGPRGKSGGASRDLLAILGLFVLLGSLVWLQFFPSTREFSAVNKPARTPESIMLLVIDPGHGGIDSGAMRAGVLEKDLTLDLAKRVQRIVQARGCHALLTRNGDEYKSLANRADFANR